MRSFLAALRVPVGLALASFALLHCAGVDDTRSSGLQKNAATNGTAKKAQHDGEGDDDDSAAAAASATGTPQQPRVEPVLTFAFDGSMSLRARVQADKLPAGGRIAVAIAAAANGEDRSAVDCSALQANGLAVSLAGATTTGKYVFADVAADMSAFSDRLDGFSRTVIQGCLFDQQGAVVAKIATSLMNAWDTTSGAASPPVFHGIEAYANSCLDELGENPMFGDGTKEFDCANDPGMKVVPITATASDGTVTRIDETTTNWPLTRAQQAATQQCDRPAWLTYNSQQQCAPFTRIGRYTNSKGTNYVVICRRESVRPLSDPSFSIIGVIAHNPNSGKTCFFNNHLDGTSSDGSKIPPPHTPVADRFWMDYGGIKDQACATCHDSDPFIHTPWIDSALAADKHALVPKIGEDPAYTLDVKYSLHASESFMQDAKGRTDWAQPRHITNAGSCGTCHRIGTKGSAQFLSAMSIGDRNTLTSFAVWDSLTPAFRTTAKLHWMPDDPSALATINACGQGGTCTSAEVLH